MARIQPPQILTANRLRTGDVVYWSERGWDDAFDAAQVFGDSSAADEALAEAQRFVADRLVVNPYLFGVHVGVDGARPIEEREVIRAAGPTVRFDIGKQSHGGCHV